VPATSPAARKRFAQRTLLRWDRRLSSRLAAGAADRDRRLSSRLAAGAADWDRRLSSRLAAGAADWDRRLSSPLAASAARCRVGGVRADQRAHARSSGRPRGMGNRPAPAPQIARRGHRAPGTGKTAGKTGTDHH
jgi:hypothetical protein